MLTFPPQHNIYIYIYIYIIDDGTNTLQVLVSLQLVVLGQALPQEASVQVLLAGMAHRNNKERTTTNQQQTALGVA